MIRERPDVSNGENAVTQTDCAISPRFRVVGTTCPDPAAYCNQVEARLPVRIAQVSAHIRLKAAGN